MNIHLIFRLAGKLLMARWKQTLVAGIGVAFSITMFIALLSFMSGLNEMLDGLILNRVAHIRLFNEIKPAAQQPIEGAAMQKDAYHFIHSIKPSGRLARIYNSKAILAALQKDPRVMGVAPRITAPVFFNDGPIDITGVINGVSISDEMNLFHFSDYVTTGHAIELETIPNGVILGKGLAHRLLAGIGDVVLVITPRGEQFYLKVIGFFESGIQEVDKTQAYASLATTQKIMNESNDYMTDLEVKLFDMAIAPATANEFRQRFGTEAEDIQTANAQFETGTFIRTLISYAVGITLLIVAGFGIYNILNMMIYEKMDSIAILKATGFSGKDVNRIFMLISMAIGVFGGVTGLLFGYLLAWSIDQVPFTTAALPTIHTYPVSYNPIIYLIATIFSLITTYFAGWAPARKASHMDPVAILRGK